ncbi:efflux RND transporter periplasmic adaptor subunit [Nitrincola sp. MINF-07-Sa-05]|uniref:efflux RND transporter periplasmic adaptor subunit n=1 Tax=Nitrincola salilacus TaxID=3400273 RepID=UPI0039180D02
MKIIPTRHLIIALAGLALVACSAENNEPVAAIQPKPVRIETVGADTQLNSRRFVGRVDAVSTVDLSFQVGGQISELDVQQGTLIKKGELIAALDQSDFALAVRESEVQKEHAQKNLERIKTLVDRNMVSDSAFDQANTDHQLQSVALDNARRNLSYTRINAPFDALITRRLIDRFSNVQANTPVVRVQDVTELRVRINVPEGLIALIGGRNGFKVEAHSPDYPEQVFPLEYREHATEVDRATQTYEVVFGMERPEEIEILPGMTLTVSITRNGSEPLRLVSVPLSAVDTDSNGNFRVWRYDTERNIVTPQAVTLGTLSGTHVPVLTGLEPGDTIVTAGTNLLSDGMSVRPFDHF